MKTPASQIITDSQSLVGAHFTNQGLKIPVYDDGYGPLYIHRDSIGISGIVRAQTWEEAYSICEDEFFPEADETIEEIIAEYNKVRRHAKIIRTPDGVEREDETTDYPFEKTGCTFVRWQTIETPTDEPGAFADNELFQEAFGFRPNGPNERDTLKHGIYAKDLNGDYLDLLTLELAESLGITLEIEDEE